MEQSTFKLVSILENRFADVYPEPNYLQITCKGLAHPDAVADRDKNTLWVEFEIKAAPFSGTFEGYVLKDDFYVLKQSFVGLEKNLSGEIQFTPYIESLDLKIKGDGLGNFVGTCKVRDMETRDTTLEFSIRFDQTMIPNLVNQLDKITSQFLGV